MVQKIRPGRKGSFLEVPHCLCQVSTQAGRQNLDEYEAEEGFTQEWVTQELVIRVNRLHNHGPADQIMLEREALVLELLLAEGYFEGGDPPL